jgi:hypothetical protein
MSLSGPLPTKPGSDEVRRLIETLAQCTGEAVRVVLSAADAGGWSELWVRELSRIPEDHRKINKRIRRRRGDRPDEQQLDLFGAQR